MKRRFAVLAAALGLGGGYALALIPDRVDISAQGTAYLSIPEDELRLLTYATKAATFTAQRSRPGMPFLVQATFADGRPDERCVATPDFEGQLGALTHFVTKRGLTLDQLDREFPVQHGVLDLRGQLNSEPGGPILVYTNKLGKSAAIVSNGTAVEVTAPLAVFKRLEAGCQGAGRN